MSIQFVGFLLTSLDEDEPYLTVIRQPFSSPTIKVLMGQQVQRHMARIKAVVNMHH